MSREATERAGEEEVGDGARGVLWNFGYQWRNVGQQLLAATRHDRVHKHHGLAPVELFEHGGECRIAEPFGFGRVAIVRDDPDPARFENVERVFDLAQTAVYIREWDDGKQTEPPRVTASKVGRVRHCRAATCDGRRPRRRTRRRVAQARAQRSLRLPRPSHRALFAGSNPAPRATPCFGFLRHKPAARSDDGHLSRMFFARRRLGEGRERPSDH